MLRTYTAIHVGCWAVMLLGVVAVGEEPVHPAVDSFFSSEDLFIQNTVLPNIEKHRKSIA